MFKGYALLRRKISEAPTDLNVLSSLPSDDVLTNLSKQPVALDFETHGLDPMDGDIRSVSLSNDAGTYAIDMEALSKSDRLKLTTWILNQKLIMHNAVFDAAWIYQKTGTMPKIECCTLVLFKLLATEGYDQQSWGLKTAMTDLLGWPESNEKDLYKWLKDNKLSKGDMAKAPWDILGKYNALDTAATWELYKYFISAMEEAKCKDSVLEFCKVEFNTLIKLLIEQQVKGITIDLDKLADYSNKLTDSIESKRQEWLTHPEIQPHVQAYQDEIVRQFVEAEPTQFTKSGKRTVAHTKWEAKVNEAKANIDFNINSTKQLQWVYFDRLDYDTPILTDKGDRSVGTQSIPHLGETGKILKEYRKLRDKKKFIVSLTEVEKDGKLYPLVKAHGTVSGRSSGGQE